MNRYEREIRQIFRKDPLEVTENDCERLYRIYERYGLDFDDVYEFCRYVGLWKNIYNLNNENFETRSKAVEELGKERDPRAIEPLIAIMMDINEQNKRDREDRIMIENIVNALGYIGDEQAIDQLIATVEDEINSRIRLKAVRSLGLIKSPKVINTLISVVLDNNEIIEIRAEASQALGRTGDKSIVDFLISILQDESEADQVLKAVAWALGEIKDPKAIDPLVSAADRNENLYHVVEWALKEIRK